MYTICCQCGELLQGVDGDGIVSHGLCRLHAREFLIDAGLDPDLLDKPEYSVDYNEKRLGRVGAGRQPGGPGEPGTAVQCDVPVCPRAGHHHGSDGR